MRLFDESRSWNVFALIVVRFMPSLNVAATLAEIPTPTPTLAGDTALTMGTVNRVRSSRHSRCGRRPTERFLFLACSISGSMNRWNGIRCRQGGPGHFQDPGDRNWFFIAEHSYWY